MFGSSVMCAIFLLWAAVIERDVSIYAEPEDLANSFAQIMFCAMVCIAANDILIQGSFSAMARGKGAIGSALLTFAHAFQIFGSILAAVVVGVLADAGRISWTLPMLVAVSLAATIPSTRNWLHEPRVVVDESHNAPLISSHIDYGGTLDGEERAISAESCPQQTLDVHQGPARTSHDSNQSHAGIFMFAVVTGCAGLFVGMTLMTMNAQQAMFTCLCVQAFLNFISFQWLGNTHARVLAAMSLWAASHISVDGAKAYFLLADSACVPSGPHFDYTFFTSVSAFVGVLASGVGLYIFYCYLGSATYRSVILYVTLAGCAIRIGDVLIVTRANRDYLGVPDRWMFLFGDVIVGPAVSMIGFMPIVILTARLCPPGVESVMYAVLAGVSNLSFVISTVTGRFLIGLFGIRSTTPCDFSALPWLIAFAGIILPLAALPAVYRLLPALRIDEEPLMS